MGLLNTVSRLGRRLWGSPERSAPRPRRGRYRTCRFEQLEPRHMLAAAPLIYVGAVYYEPHLGNDNAGNEFIITWTGGAPGTELTRLVIDLDKQGDGLTFEDTFFDTAAGGLGDTGPGNGFVPLIIGAHDGFSVFGADGVSPPAVADGSTLLELTFQGFTAGKRLFFRIDVDERGFPNDNAVAEAQEFQGSKFTVTFVNPDFQTSIGTDIFTDDSDAKMAPSGLNLPPNSYLPEPPERFLAPFAPGATAPDPLAAPENLYTAAALVALQQQPLPSSISGRVHVDQNGDCTWQPGETLLSGVVIQLLDGAGNPMLDAGGNPITAVTDANGVYKFENLAPGVYGVRELQPAGYFNGGTIIGTEGGASPVPDTVLNIDLPANRDAVGYNFCEKLGSLSGKVYVDANGDCTFQPGETLLPGVVLRLLDGAGNPLLDAGGNLITAVTDANGNYVFSNLAPGVYGVEELQPPQYFEGCAKAGSLGGTVVGTNFITLVDMTVHRTSVENNFAERLGQISGQVIVVTGGDCDDPASTKTPLPGVSIFIFSSGGFLVQQTVTNANGQYLFTNLLRDTYTIVEGPTPGYVDIDAHPGTIGGVIVGTAAGANVIVGVALVGGNVGIDYDFCETLPPPPPPFFPLQPPPAAAIPPSPPVPPPPPLPPVAQLPPPLFVPVPPLDLYGNGPIVGYTWHLSVINAGQPRNRGRFDVVSQTEVKLGDDEGWSVLDVKAARFRLRKGRLDEDGITTVVFGLRGAAPVIGDFNGDGLADVGVYYQGQWFIDLNGNGVWDNEDLWAKLGTVEDLPVVGDWDGDGKTDIGIYGRAWPGDPRAIAAEPGLPNPDNAKRDVRKNSPPRPEIAPQGSRIMQRTSLGKARADLIDHVFAYGAPGDWPIAGNWNGNGADTIGVFRDGRWDLDVDGDGKFSAGDVSFIYGQAGDMPVIGDFDGDGTDEIGVFRNGKWIIDTNHNRILDAEDTVLEFGGPGDRPVVGDFDGDGTDEIGVYEG